MKNKKLIYIFTIIIIILILIMAIAYSALSENLKITYGKVNQNAETWDVAFKSEIITPTSSGTSTSGLSCGQATASGLTVNIEDTEMSKPGDKCIWKFTVENKGTIDAEISSIDFTHPTEQECTRTFGNSVDVCGNITYKLLKDNSGSTSSRIKRKDLINASSSEEIFLYAEYTGEEINSSKVIHTSTKFSILYSQK